MDWYTERRHYMKVTRESLGKPGSDRVASGYYHLFYSMIASPCSSSCLRARMSGIQLGWLPNAFTSNNVSVDCEIVL